MNCLHDVGVLPVLKLREVEVAVSLAHLADSLVAVQQVKAVLEAGDELPVHLLLHSASGHELLKNGDAAGLLDRLAHGHLAVIARHHEALPPLLVLKDTHCHAVPLVEHVQPVLVVHCIAQLLDLVVRYHDDLAHHVLFEGVPHICLRKQRILAVVSMEAQKLPWRCR